jgi:hypothetical protein
VEKANLTLGVFFVTAFMTHQGFADACNDKKSFEAVSNSALFARACSLNKKVCASDMVPARGPNSQGVNSAVRASVKILREHISCDKNLNSNMRGIELLENCQNQIRPKLQLPALPLNQGGGQIGTKRPIPNCDIDCAFIDFEILEKTGVDLNLICGQLKKVKASYATQARSGGNTQNPNGAKD